MQQEMLHRRKEAAARLAGLAAAAATALVTLGATAAPQPRAAREPSPAAYEFRIEEVFIPMKDGVRLAADLYLPREAAPGEKFPALLEYLPYRKDDGSTGHYEVHAYFARRGYASARVDIRGTGRSEGAPPDREYSDEEQLDGLQVIAWLASRPWSSGKVGMFGISWGGFNSIQLAARRPPALKAILAVEATEDLFQDDVHYIDGLFHFDEYELSMDLQPAITAHPDYPLEKKALAGRFDSPPWSLLYKRQQRDGEFWERASTRNRLADLTVPAFLIAGWLDGYRDSVPRMLERMKGPVKAIVGPWNHSYPHDAAPGPEIEWRREAVRFWDYWLKGRDTGVMDEPRLAVYVRHWHPPDPALETIPGEWRSEDGWPIQRTRLRTLYPSFDHTLEDAAGAPAAHDLKYVPSAGISAGFWWGEIAPDQRPVDAFSLVYDSAPLEQDTEILGFPEAHLRASASAPLAHWFVRLSDVAPDATTTLVTGAGLNGAHRESTRDPKPLEAGRIYPLEIEMHFTSWVFPKGHRIRLAVSNALWPMIWPTPHPMTTSLHLGGAPASRLVLPVIPAAPRPRPRFEPPEPSEPQPGVRSAGGTWPGEFTLVRDENRRTARVDWSGTSITERPWGKLEDSEKLSYRVEDARPEAASVRAEAETTLRLPGRVLTWRVVTELTSDLTRFFYRHYREVLENGVRVRDKSWEETIPRDHQ